MPPKFAFVIPKCSRCTQSVYPMEQVEYDKKLYHQTCFKCLECKSSLNLSRIAQINNDLYCKTCFMRIFTKDGKYTSFGGVAAETRRATITGGVAPGPSPPPNSNSIITPSSSSSSSSSSLSTSSNIASSSNNTSNNNNNNIGAKNTNSSYTAISSRINSVRSRTATFAGPSTITVTPPSTSSSSLLSLSSSSPSLLVVETPEQRELTGIFEAISARNVDRTKELVLNSSLGVDILFKQNAKGITPVEFSFSGFNNAKAVGNMLLNLLSSQMLALRLSSGNATGSSVSKPSLSPTASPSPQNSERTLAPQAVVA